MVHIKLGPERQERSMTAGEPHPQEHCGHECVCWGRPGKSGGPCSADACEHDTRSHSSSPAPVPKKALIFVPMSSTELLVMADKEWTNREERKHRHDKASWISGWLDGYFSKPVTIDEHDEQIRQQAAEAAQREVLDAIREWTKGNSETIEADDGTLEDAVFLGDLLAKLESLRSGEGVQR